MQFNDPHAVTFPSQDDSENDIIPIAKEDRPWPVQLELFEDIPGTSETT